MKLKLIKSTLSISQLPSSGLEILLRTPLSGMHVLFLTYVCTAARTKSLGTQVLKEETLVLLAVGTVERLFTSPGF
jgi:hypothetical protein